MKGQLSLNEEHFLDEFLKAAGEKKPRPFFSSFYAYFISVLGLILLVAAVIITLGNLNNQIVYWIFLPGLVGGIGIILFGWFLLKFLKKAEEQEKLAEIIRKLL